MTFETIDAVVGLDAFHLDGHPTSELLRRRHLSNCHQTVGACEQCAALRRSQLGSGAGDDIDVRSRRRAVTQRVRQHGCRRECPGALRRPHRRTQRRLRRRRHPGFGESVSRQLRHQNGLLGVGPGLHLADRDQTRLDQIIARRSVIAHGNDVLHTLGNSNRIHTPDHREGVSHSCRTVVVRGAWRWVTSAPSDRAPGADRRCRLRPGGTGSDLGGGEPGGEIWGERAGERDPFAGRRVDEGQLRSVEERSGQPERRATLAVGRVADERMVDRRQVDTDLVRRPVSRRHSRRETTAGFEYVPITR